ncbi:MAG: ComF family protein [Pseudomonadota bacterium]
MQYSILNSSLKNRVRSLVKGFANVIVPNTCLICDAYVAQPGGCCATCWSKLSFVKAPMCPVMGIPFQFDMGDKILSAEAIANPPPFERLRTVFLYDDEIRRLVSLIKYSDRTDLVPWIANWMMVAGGALLDDANYIVPVPLHVSRLRKRRFNQSAELARCIGKSRNLAYAPELLIRRKATRQQVGLTENQRERNVSGAFSVPEASKPVLSGKRILLVDDVYTTGATVKAATRALLRAGASNIDVLVLAKVETDPL